MSKGMGILCGVAALSLVLGVPEARADAPAPAQRTRPASPAAGAPADQSAPAVEGGLLRGPATVPAHWSRNRLPGHHPGRRSLLHRRQGRHPVGHRPPVPRQPLPLAPDLGPQSLHHGRPLDLPRRRPDHPRHQRGGPRRGRHGRGDGRDAGEPTATRPDGRSEGDRTRAHPGHRGDGAPVRSLRRGRPRGREPDRHRLRGRRHQGGLRRPRHPVPEQGRERGREGRGRLHAPPRHLRR